MRLSWQRSRARIFPATGQPQSEFASSRANSTFYSRPTLCEDLKALILQHATIYVNSSLPAEALILRRVLYATNHVLKELTSVKMPAGSRNMVQASNQQTALRRHLPNTQVKNVLAGFLQTFYAEFSRPLVTGLDPQSLQSPQMLDTIRLAHLSYKCLAKIMTWLASKINQREFADAQTEVTAPANLFPRKFKFFFLFLSFRLLHFLPARQPSCAPCLTFGSLS